MTGALVVLLLCGVGTAPDGPDKTIQNNGGKAETRASGPPIFEIKPVRGFRLWQYAVVKFNTPPYRKECDQGWVCARPSVKSALEFQSRFHQLVMAG